MCKISRILTPYIGLNTLVHVGAHLGQELDEYMALDIKKLVYVEADPILYKLLLERVKGIKTDKNIVIVNALVGSNEGQEMEFFVYNNYRGSSSIYKPTTEMNRLYPDLAMTDEKITLRTQQLSTILSNLNIVPNEVDAIVYDIQGSEYAALLGSIPYLRNPYYIEVEVSTVPIYKGAPLFNDINLMLSSLGYKCITKSIPSHGDVMFQNKLRLKK